MLSGAVTWQYAFGCSGVTVNSATANSATTVKANITVTEAAAGGACDVTVTGGATGSVGVICANAFTVVPKLPCTITVAPSHSADRHHLCRVDQPDGNGSWWLHV